MKDAYSFHTAAESLDETYRAMERRLPPDLRRAAGCDYTAVEADTGNIGGSESHEFMVLAETGEDAVVALRACGYGANVEKAATGRIAPPPAWPRRCRAGPEAVHTPGTTLGRRTSPRSSASTRAHFVKTLIFETDKEFVVALVRGDDEVNEVKLKNALDVHAPAARHRGEGRAGHRRRRWASPGRSGARRACASSPTPRSMRAARSPPPAPTAADDHLVGVVPGPRLRAPDLVADLRHGARRRPVPALRRAARRSRAASRSGTSSSSAPSTRRRCSATSSTRRAADTPDDHGLLRPRHRPHRRRRHRAEPRRRRHRLAAPAGAVRGRAHRAQPRRRRRSATAAEQLYAELQERRRRGALRRPRRARRA